MTICGNNATEFNEIINGPVSLFLLKLSGFLEQNKVREKKRKEKV